MAFLSSCPPILHTSVYSKSVSQKSHVDWILPRTIFGGSHIMLGRSTFVCCSSKRKPSFADQILDYIEGGPKLRKWYGAPDLLPKDGAAVDEEEYQEEVEARDAILVTDGDGDMGQMVILQLILKRVRVKALVKDKQNAIEAFGSYVEPMSGDANNKSFLKNVFRGVRAIICPSIEGFVLDIQYMKGIQHVVLLSQLAVYKGSSGLQALVYSNVKKLAEKNEAAIIGLGIPYTIIRAGLLQDNPGGEQGFSFREGVASEGRLGKEDAARICVEALDVIPNRGLIFEVVNGEEQVSDWKEQLLSLLKDEDF